MSTQLPFSWLRKPTPTVTEKRSRPPKRRNSGLAKTTSVLHTRVASMVVLHNPRWDGIYMVIVSEATEGVSKNGNPYVDLTLVIANAVDPEHIGYTVRFQKLYFT